jgi:hypothetical protein
MIRLCLLFLTLISSAPWKPLRLSSYFGSAGPRSSPNPAEASPPEPFIPAEMCNTQNHDILPVSHLQQGPLAEIFYSPTRIL